MIKRLSWCVFVMCFGCAQMRSLSGGEKDTIPPNIIQTTPQNLSINVENNEFYFVFDEVVDGSKLKEKLIISPFYGGSFESTIKKNTLLLSFDTAFQEETTYIFNFADGISDITEGNPSIYSKFVFSTGKKIDSSFVEGVVYDPLENKFIDGAVVGLYNKKDSFGLFETKPTYFSLTNKMGHFKIENIKKGSYVIYAFLDENNNFKAEYKTEKFGFKSDLINVDSSLKKILMPVFLEDLSKIKIQRTRKKGNVFDVVYNKNINEYLVNTSDINNSLYDNKTVSFFKNNSFADSSLVIITAVDKTNKKTTDSIYVSFGEEEKGKLNVESSFEASSQNIDDSVYYDLKTNIPLYNYLYKSDFYIDTVKVPSSFALDNYTKKNNGLIQGTLYVFYDSIEFFIKEKKENIKKDSSFFENDSIYGVFKNYYDRLNIKKITYKINKGELITITKDTLKEITKDFNIRGDEYFGSVSGFLSGFEQNKNYVIEMVSENLSQVLKNEQKTPSFMFSKLTPGKYYLRLFKDDNKNKKWDYYSITSRKESESIFFYNDLVEIRSNWSIEDLEFNVDLSVEKLFLKDSLIDN